MNKISPISVVILCHNYARYLPDAINSILLQSVKPSEIIVVNDDSSDNTGDVARQFPVKVIDVMCGSESGAANIGFEASSYPYILRLDADDLLHEDYIAKTWSVLANRGDLAFVYTRGVMFGNETRLLWSRDFAPETILMGNYISSIALFRRSVLEMNCSYDETFLWGPDWDFWLQCVSHSLRGCLVPEFLFFYRRHGTSISSTFDREMKKRQLAMVRKKHRALFTRRQRWKFLVSSLAYRLIGSAPSKIMALSPEKYLRWRHLLKVGLAPPLDFQPGLNANDVLLLSEVFKTIAQSKDVE